MPDLYNGYVEKSMQGYYDGIMGPSTLDHYNVSVECSLLGYYEGLIGPSIPHHYNGLAKSFL
jgi:hypothetical protein